MQLVEQHVIESSDPRFVLIDEAAFKSKNLYNAALYLIRQILMMLDRNWKSYKKQEQQADVDPTLYAGIDVGVNNLAAITSNKPEFIPVLVNGRPMKSWNQFYNKRKAALQKKLGKTGTTRRMERLTKSRNRRIDLLVKERISTLVIGKNPEWKQEVEMGKRNNQTFVQIPHARFIDMLSYKAHLVGIRVLIVEESYTSKCSFLDKEPIGKHERYLGKRGLLRGSKWTMH
jgi:putative transposase